MIRKPNKDNTMNTIWGTKLPSVIAEVVVTWFVLGVTAKASIRMPGTSRPTSEYSYGFAEFLQARHHIIENTTAMIMIKVPTPMPRTRAEVVVCDSAVWMSNARGTVYVSMDLSDYYLNMYIWSELYEWPCLIRNNKGF